MNKRLLIGTGLLMLAVVASLIVFTTSPNAETGGQQSALGSVEGEPSQREPVAQEISEPEAEPQLEVAQSIVDADTEAMAVSATDEVPDGTGEGIKVHGHWTIDVHESDGKLVSHNEFDNALMTFGATSLVQFLAKDLSVGGWQIQVAAASSADWPCTSSFGGNSTCILSDLPASHSLIVSAPDSMFPDLSVTENAAGALKLAGSITINRDGEIGTVITYVANCSSSNPATAASIGPSYNCPTGEIGIFQGLTYKDLASPVPVLTGQIVNITVVISFS